MKFKIRFADQIVGFFIILSVVALVFVTVMLGKSQRWFAKDYYFSTVLPSAGGLSKNLAVQFRGFTIGNIKEFQLTENDEVEVIFTIHDEYKNRVKKGSMVELMVSPVGLGNQFLFHAGGGEELAEGAFIPIVGSAQARELIRQGFAVELQHDDSISLLMKQVSSVLDEVNQLLVNMNGALGAGNSDTELGKIIGSMQKTLAGVEDLPVMVDETMVLVTKMLEDINVELMPLLANANILTAELADPNGVLSAALDTNGEIYKNLVESLGSVTAILKNLDKASAFVPAQLPQFAGIIMELRTTMKTAEDVLVALTNNPLLRRGVPGRPESESGGTSPRNIRF